MESGALGSKSASNSLVQLSANAIFNRLAKLTSPVVSNRFILAWVTPDLSARVRRDKLLASRLSLDLAAILLCRSPDDWSLIGNILSIIRYKYTNRHYITLYWDCKARIKDWLRSGFVGLKSHTCATNRWYKPTRYKARVRVIFRFSLHENVLSKLPGRQWTLPACI